jgi:hypothetical protein
MLKVFRNCPAESIVLQTNSALRCSTRLACLSLKLWESHRSLNILTMSLSFFAFPQSALDCSHWESNLPRPGHKNVPRFSASTGAPFCAHFFVTPGHVLVPRFGHLFVTPGHVFVPRSRHLLCPERGTFLYPYRGTFCDPGAYFCALVKAPFYAPSGAPLCDPGASFCAPVGHQKVPRWGH